MNHCVEQPKGQIHHTGASGQQSLHLGLHEVCDIHPEIATNEGLPGVGKVCDDSKAAKENIRFKRRERREISGLLMIVSYSGGKGGSGGIRANLFPFGPQQKPGLSPVKRMTLQILHACMVPCLFVTAPHWRFGEEIGPISHVSVFEVCNSYMNKSLQLALLSSHTMFVMCGGMAQKVQDTKGSLDS